MQQSQLWDGQTFTDKFVAVIGEAVEEVFGRMQDEQQQTLVRERARQAALERQKQKLIDAYLADAIPVEDLKSRQSAVQEELVEVRKRIEEASSNRAGLKRHVRESLELLRQAGELDRRSDEHSRQSLNQVFFDRAYIDVDEDGFVKVVSVEVKDEFQALIELVGQVTQSRAVDGLLPGRGAARLGRRLDSGAAMMPGRRPGRLA